MKQLEPQNLFELEGLEPRILLSGDPLLATAQVDAMTVALVTSLFSADPVIGFRV